LDRIGIEPNGMIEIRDCSIEIFGVGLG